MVSNGITANTQAPGAAAVTTEEDTPTTPDVDSVITADTSEPTEDAGITIDTSVSHANVEPNANDIL